MTSKTHSDPVTVLVTGANGFVGGWLAARLARSGHDVRLTDLQQGPAASTDRAGEDLSYTGCDLTDRGEVVALLERTAPDWIAHLAAQSSAALSFMDPLATFEVNLTGTLNLLEAARNTCPRARILLTGSCEEYGRRSPGEMPLAEDSPLEPVSPYAASKVAQEAVALQYHRAFGSRVILTRSFSHTGPGQTDRFVLPSFARQCAREALGRGEGVIRTGDLEVVRDFLDVRDVVGAYERLLAAGAEGAAYNVCRGEGLKLGEALSALRGMAGGEIRVETDPELLRPVDVPVLIGDNSKLTADTGWRPEMTATGMLEALYRWWLGKETGD